MYKSYKVYYILFKIKHFLNKFIKYNLKSKEIIY